MRPSTYVPLFSSFESLAEGTELYRGIEKRGSHLSCNRPLKPPDDTPKGRTVKTAKLMKRTQNWQES